MSKVAKFKRRRRKRNPESESTSVGGFSVPDWASNIGAGFAGYAATRLVSRMIFSRVVKKYPNASDHAAVLSSVAAALGTHFGSKYWEKAQPFHEPLSLGATIAAIQTAIQTYVPKYAWIVSDLKASDYAPAPSLGTPVGAAAKNGASFDLDKMLDENDDIEAIPLGSLGAGDDAPLTDDDLDEMAGMMN